MKTNNVLKELQHKQNDTVSYYDIHQCFTFVNTVHNTS